MREKFAKRILCILVVLSFLLPTYVKADEGNKPDLSVKIIGYNPSNPKEGDMITIITKVANIGNQDVKNFTFIIACDTVDIIESKSISSLASNAFINISTNWLALKGNHTITAIVDANGNISELSETNNDDEISIFCCG